MRRLHWIMLSLLLFAAVVSLLAGMLTPWRTSAGNEEPGAGTAGPRIVAFSPALGVILTDLGLGDRIVGRHAFDITLDDSVPVVGDMSGIDYERLLRLDPTHILIEESASALPDRLLTLGRKKGWVIRSFPMLTLNDIPEATRRIADLFDSPAVRRRLATLLSDLDKALQPNPGFARRAGRVLPLYWTNPPGAAGPGSFHAEMLAQLGCQPALTEGGPYITIEPEDILRMDPDSILLLIPGADPDRLDALLGPLGMLDLRCVREGRVAVISHRLVNLPATSIVDVVREILETTADWTPPAKFVAN